MSEARVYFDEVGEFKLDEAVKLLAGIPGGVYKAVGSAIKRSAKHGLTVGMRIVSKEYAATQKVLKASTKNINTIVKGGAGSYEVTFGYRGNLIPLMKYDTRVNRKGQVKTRVLRQNSRQTLDHAFAAQMGGHKGIYERLTEKRFPVRELFGPSAVQAFYARESTVDKMDEEIRATYDKRIEHEVLRILNGWGL
jgi:hypothetical protein